MTRIRKEPRVRNTPSSLRDAQKNPRVKDAPVTPAPSNVEAIPAQRQRTRRTIHCREYAYVWKSHGGEIQCQTSMSRDKEKMFLQSCREYFTSTPSEQATNPHDTLEGNPQTPGPALALRSGREGRSKETNENSSCGTICPPYPNRSAPDDAEIGCRTITIGDRDAEIGWRMITLRDKDAITKFFDEQLTRIGQISLKTILKAWIREIHPQKQGKYPYNGGKTKKKAIQIYGPKYKGHLTKPEWWPRDVRHCEPDHQSKPERLDLAKHILRYDAFNSESLRRSTTDIANFLGDRFKVPVTSLLSHIYDVRQNEERYLRGEISGHVKLRISVSDPRDRNPRAYRKILDKVPAHRSKKAAYRTSKCKDLPKPSNSTRLSPSVPSQDSNNPNRDLGEPFQADRSLPIFNYGNAGVNEYHRVGPLHADFAEQSYFPTVDMREDHQAYRHLVPFTSEFPGMEGVFSNQTASYNPAGHFVPLVPSQRFYESEPEPHQVPLSSTNPLGHDSGVHTTPAGFSPAAYYSAAERCPHGVPRDLCVHRQVYSPTTTICTLDVPYTSTPFSTDDSTWEMVGSEDYPPDLPQSHSSMPE